MLRTFQVDDVRRATPTSRVLRLRLDGEFTYQPGQSALIGLHGQPDRRHYSFASPPEIAARTAALEFLVRSDRDGGIGPHLDGARRGARVDVEGPVGTFTLPSRFTERHLLFVAGGTGIAPVRAMLMRAIEMDGLSIALAYSTRTSREFAFLPELQRLRARGLRLALAASREAPASWRHHRGRLNQSRLAPLIETPATLCFVCGPPALVEDVPRSLMMLGIEEGRIRTEIF